MRSFGLTAGGRFARPALPWWLEPAATSAGLVAFVLYTAWSVLVAGRAEHGPYLSPLHSPRFGAAGPLSPALLILPIPLLFRATCYYFRRAYHRALLWDPPACAVGELRRRRPYRGEARLPLSLASLHRVTLAAALVLLLLLWADAAAAFRYRGHLYAGLGGALLVADAGLLTAYTLGCHSLRHLVGGCLDRYSGSLAGVARHHAWRLAGALNARHGWWGWLSLGGVVAADAYVRLLQHGLADPHLLG